MLFRQGLDKKCVRHLVYDDWQDKDSSCQENLGPFRRRPFHGRSVMVTQVQIYKSLTCSSTTCLDGQLDFLPPGPCIKQYFFSLHSFKVYIDWNKVMAWYTKGPHSTRPQIQKFLNSIPVGSNQSHIVENHFPKEKHMFEANRLKASCVLFFFYFVCLFAFLKLPVLCACTARCVLATFHVMHCLRLAYYG